MENHQNHSDDDTGIEFHIYSQETLYPNDIERIINERKSKNSPPYNKKEEAIYHP